MQDLFKNFKEWERILRKFHVLWKFKELLMKFKDFERFFGNVKVFFFECSMILKESEKNMNFKQIEGILGNVKEFHRILMIFYEF